MVQRRAARWTCSNCDRNAGVTEMLNNLGWHSLEQSRAARLCLIYKIVYGLVAIPFPYYIQMSTRACRFNHDFRQVYASRDYYKYSFSPLAIVQWNVLSESAVCKTSPEAFKAEALTSLTP